MRKVMLLIASLAMMLTVIAPAMAHETEESHEEQPGQSQVAESGDVEQSFDVSQTGDNSNQCAGVQGVANTGNAQNQISLDLGTPEQADEPIDVELLADVEELFGADVAEDLLGEMIDAQSDESAEGNETDISLEDVGSTIEVSPVNTTDCEQSVDQTATAYGSSY